MTTTALWQNRITGYGTEAPDQLAANPRNWRIHPKAQQAALEGSLAELGWIQNVIVNQQTGFVLDGHARVALALRTDQREVPVTYVDLSPDEEALALATLDPISAMAGADKDQLEALLREIGTGPDALQPLLDDLAKTNGIASLNGGLTDPDDVPEPPAEPITKPGDLWLLGEHRLLCGDSTKAEDVAYVMAGERAGMMFTDPPWNVAIGLDSNPRHRQRTGLTNDSLPAEEFAVFLDRFVAAAKPFLGGDCYCILGASEWPTLDATLRRNGLHWSATIIWVKDAFVLGRSKYHRRYEPIWYGWLEGATSSFNGRRDLDDVWEFARPRRSEEHPTMKPVALVTAAVENSSEPGDLVLDPFGGAGSTLIACEQERRRCAMLEIDPQYCDVIVTRWEQFTGNTASRERREDAA